MPFFNCNGFKIFYLRLGLRTNLPPLVFVHGIWANHLTWIKQIHFFSKYTEVFVYDLPGHGKSDKPAIDYTIPMFAMVLRKFIKEINIHKPIIVGHSLGGVIAQTLAIKDPNLIQKLILLCTGVNIGVFGKKIQIPYYILVFLKKILSKFRWAFVCKILAKFSSKKEIKGLEGKNLEAGMAVTCSGKAMLSIVFHLMQYDISQDISSIKIPILFITGTKDMFYNQVPVYQNLQASVRIKKGGEHGLHLYSEGINQWILDFIKK